MNIVKETLENQAALLKVTVAPADYAEAVEKALKNYRKKANMPGFRPGMVPMGVINKMYRKGVTAEESYRKASEAMIAYLDENKIGILGEPLPSKEQKDLDFENDTEFEFCFEVGLAPEVNIDLGKVSVNRYAITVSDQMKKDYKDNYLRRFGKLADTDTVTSDEALTVTLDQEGMTVEDAYVGLIGMSEEERKPFIGKKVGDKMEVNVNDLYKQASQRAAVLQVKEDELANIDPVFNLTITRIRKFENPEMNEAFFKEAFPAGDITDETQFDAMIAAKVAGDLEQETKYKFVDDTKKALLKAAALTLPEPFLKNWLYAINDGKFSMEEIDKDFPQFVEMMAWDVIKRHYAQEAKIEVTKEDAVAEAKATAAMQFAYYGMPNVEEGMLNNYADSMLANKEEARKIYDRLAENKIVDYVASKIKVKEKKVSREEFVKLFEAPAAE